MTPERFQQVKRVFAAASKLAHAEQRTYLREACEGDAELRAEVESLLAHDEKSLPLEPGMAAEAALAEFHARVADGSSAAAGLQSVAEKLPERIGRYRILRELGRGGMGVVYEAEQDQPRRTIALKVIRPGVVSEQLLRRFELEAHVLGRLQHPGIAQVHEAGTAQVEMASGVTVAQPFFAMEYVRGEPLSESIRRPQSGLRARLELFARICDAVQHAHQNGVIHRDLKPGNILVDERGQPKILDFGVARVTDVDVQVTTLHTNVGQLIGTLPYMSPEQVAGDPRKIDTRSDVYALGVIGYQLLAGCLPYAIQDQTLPEAARTIAEQDPTPLSSINRVFRGDLEAIVTKALEKDKERRYQSASDLAADVRRYLADEPVVALPVTTWYQLRKFARRNRGIVASVLGMFAVLVIGTVVSTWLAVWARGAEALAQERYTQAEDARQAADVQRVEAMTEAARATALGDFLAQMLQQVDPDVAQGRDASLLRDVLDQAARDVEVELAGYPDVQADIHQVIGTVYRKISLYEEAERHYQTAYDLSLAQRGEDAAETLAALRGLAQVLWDQGLLDAAEPMYEQLISAYSESLGETHRETLVARYELAGVWRDGGRTDAAEVELRDLLEAMQTHLGPGDDAVIDAMNGLAVLAMEREQVTEETVQLLQAVVRHWTETRGDNHPMRIKTLRNLATVFKNRGALEEAEVLLREALARHQEVFGEDHHDTIQTLVNLAGLLRERSQLTEAEVLARQAHEQAVRVLGPEHPDTVTATTHLGIILRMKDQFDEAQKYLEQAVGLSVKLHGRDDSRTLNRLSSLAGLFYDQQQFAAAEPVVRQVVEGLRAVHGERSFATLAATNNMGSLLVQLGKLEEAADTLERTLTLADEAAPPGHWFRWTVRANYGECLTHMERFAEAEELLVAAHEGFVNSLGPEHQRTQGAAHKLVELYEAWGQPEIAAKYVAASQPEDADENAARQPVEP